MCALFGFPCCSIAAAVYAKNMPPACFLNATTSSSPNRSPQGRLSCRCAAIHLPHFVGLRFGHFLENWDCRLAPLPSFASQMPPPPPGGGLKAGGQAPPLQPCTSLPVMLRGPPCAAAPGMTICFYISSAQRSSKLSRFTARYSLSSVSISTGGRGTRL